MRVLLMAMMVCTLLVLTVGAAVDGPLFESSVHYKVQDEPQGVCIADFNNDGVYDMACASYEVDSISVLIGIEDGGYESRVDYYIGSSTYNIEAADIDGDTYIDLVVNTSSAIFTLDNTGSGTFDAPVQISGLADSPHDFQLALVDADSDYDLIVSHADWSYDKLSVWDNDGSGTFTFDDEYTVGTNQMYVCVGDFNSNGRPDIAVTFNVNEFKVLLNDGTGSYTVDDTYAMARSTYGLCADTFDAGSNVDLAVSTDISIEIYTGDGAGKFSLLGSVPTTSDGYGLAAADFDGQNGPDLVLACDSVEVYYNNGAGGFPTSNTYFAGDETEYLAVGDLDGDGNPDLAVTASPDYYDYWPGHVAVLLNPEGNGDFSYPIQSATGDYTMSLCKADFNGDGDMDIASLDYWDDSVRVFLGDGAGSFTRSFVGPIGDYSWEIIAADLDGINNEDLIIGYSSTTNNYITVLLGDGDGTFGAPSNYTVGLRPRGVFAAELDGANGLDIATTNSTDQTISVLFNNGSGGFGAATSYASVSASGHSAIDGGDLNGDSQIDLVVPNYTNGCVQVYWNNAGDFTSSSNIGTGEVDYPYQVCVEDLNDDGDDDIIVGSYDSTEVTVFMNNGSGFDAADYYYAGYEHVEIGVADFDADGFKDIIILNCDSYSFSVFFGDGAGNFSDGGHYGIISDDSEGLALADFDGDGYTDVAVSNYNHDNVSVMLNRYTILTPVTEIVYGDPVPAKFMLSQNYPNPFNPATTIQYSLPRRAEVSICVYNLLGQRVKVFHEGVKSAGTHQVVWDGQNNSGRSVATGVYLYQLRAGDFVESRKMLLLK